MPASPLKTGALLGDRYEVTATLADSAFGTLYRAVDREAARVVIVRAIRNDLLVDKGAPARLYAEIKKASKLDHKNIVRTAGLVTGDGLVALITQQVVGQSLRQMMTERGSPFSFKGAYNVIAHLANALDYAHHLTLHGCVTASNILINRAGRIKLAEFGLATAFPQALRDIPDPERASLAPEIVAPTPSADTRADVFSLGAVLFELLTGQPLIVGVHVSELAPGLPDEVDQIVARMVGPAAGRPDPTRVKATLAKILDQLPRSETSGQFRVSPVRAATPPAIPPRPSALTPAPAPLAVTRAVGSGKTVSASPAKTAPTKDSGEARWIIRKGKLDFGPYSLAQVKEQIATDEVLPEHLLVDNDTGERLPIEHHPMLGELAIHAAHRRNDARRAHVEATVVKQHKRRGFALYGFIGAGAIGLCLAAFLVWRVLGAGSETRQKETTQLAGADLAGLKVGSARKVDAPKKIGGPHVPSSGSHPGGKGDNFDEQAMDMTSDGVGDERLDDSQIDGVLGKHVGALGHCLSEEVGRGGVHKADIDFVVLGSGKVSAVRVNGDSGTALAGCIRGVMQTMQFPTFNGTRTRASFPISL